ncbi:MAG: L-threonylcarbamoyladenylate synthase [Oscillospiraceae bacterium]|nr:L-threonylcarbamoyladenylate synthase [Oscillospiraceae bacterium]
METTLIKINSTDETEKLLFAAEILRRGGLVAIPTETVYGLAANALDASAVRGIFRAKGRPADNPLIVHIASFEELGPLVSSVPEKAVKLARAFWPGPLTMVLPKSDLVPGEVTCGLPSVAVRMPSHPIANAVIRAAGAPLAAPSANASGKPSPTAAAHVLHDLSGKIDAVVDGGPCDVGVESTVITLCTEIPTVLRPGGVTVRQLREIIGQVDVHPSVFKELEGGAKPASPGMKYRHYSPSADITVVRGGLDAFAEYVRDHQSASCAVLCFDGEERRFGCETFTYGKKDDPKSQARRLYGALRQIDESDVKRVFARCPDPVAAQAVYNRLLRAAGFKIQILE